MLESRDKKLKIFVKKKIGLRIKFFIHHVNKKIKTKANSLYINNV